MGSPAVEDVCGVCNGDATHCKVIKDVFTGTGQGILKKNNATVVYINTYIFSGYTKIATIPIGSRYFKVSEKAASTNTLAIGTDDGSHYYLNGGK